MLAVRIKMVVRRESGEGEVCGSSLACQWTPRPAGFQRTSRVTHYSVPQREWVKRQCRSAEPPR
jgi:hypothetical protein